MISSITESNLFQNVNFVHHAKSVFVITITILHILYFIAFLGVFVINDEYVRFLNIFVQSFVILFLIIRFHPYKSVYSITPADRTFVFGGAMLLATNLITVELASWIPIEKYKTITMELRDYIFQLFTKP